MLKVVVMAVLVSASVALGGWRQRPQTQQSSAQQNSSASQRLEFEVAVIKPSAPNTQGGGMKADPGGQTIHALNVPVQLMIESQWRINGAQIVGAPDWASKDLWNVEAKAEGPHNIEDLHVMYQNLMIDRFKMQFHWDTRDLPMFALLLDKSGLKMTENSGPETFDIRAQMVAFGKLQGKRCDLKYFTWIISLFPWINRPVVDETGLDKSKFYDFTLLFAPEVPAEIAAPGNLPAAPGPDFFTAIREQLGLRLEARKGPVPVMVVDHIEKPSSSDN
jgi:uncharacterized protein (TIGR03435 family)